MKPILVKAIQLGIGIFATYLSAGLLRAGSPVVTPAAASWNPKAAADYLDRRESWWMAWPPAKRDHGTFCVSCHTVAPFALARPALRAALGEKDPSDNERRLLESVTQRVRLWKDVAPFYAEAKALQSRATESVLNALILASADARNGKMSADTRAAFDHMWALQVKTGDQRGAWTWLNFGNEPFEADDSQYYGASLAALAVGMAPENYRATPPIQNNLKLLADYLRRECARQLVIHQMVSLWASTKWPGLFAPDQQKSIIDNVLGKQQADGGWGLSSLNWTWRGYLHSLVNQWTRSSGTPPAKSAPKSDGYATGLIVFVLGQAGIPPKEAHLRHGRSWLLSNQNQTEGLWPGYPLPDGKDPTSGTGRFANDAATAYAVLALTSANSQ